MNTPIHKIALTAALLAAAGFASAQTPAVNGAGTTAGSGTAMGGPTRTEVKNEAKMVEREGMGTSAGAASKPGPGTDMAHKPTMGGESRADVKSEAKMAAHSKMGTSMGEASTGTGRDAAHKRTAKHSGKRMEKHAEGVDASKMPAVGAGKAQ